LKVGDKPKPIELAVSLEEVSINLLSFGHFNLLDIVATEFLKELIKTIRNMRLL